MAQTSRLQSLFMPQSVAVVGASDRPGSRGTYLWNSVLRSGRLQQTYPVNPKYKYLGIVPCWSKLEELPGRVDLVVIATPSRTVLDLLEQCAKLEIKYVLVTPGDESLTTDFRWRNEIASFAQEHGIFLVGPDSIGLSRPEMGFNVSYWEETPRIGNIALLAQSGSLCAQMLAHARRFGLGFSSVLHFGLSSDTLLTDAVDFFAGDPKTDVLAIQIDTLRSPRPLVSALRAIAMKKRVVLLRHTERGGVDRLVHARFGHAMGNDELLDALCRRSRIILSRDIDAFSATLSCLSAWSSLDCERLGLITNGLGFATQAADALEAVDIEPSTVESSLLEKLTSIQRSPNPILNPLNLGEDATADQLASALDAMLAMPSLDSVLLAMAPFSQLNPATLIQALAPVLKEKHKPIIIVEPTALSNEDLREAFVDHGAAVVGSFAAAAQALACIRAHRRSCALLMQESQENVQNDRRNLDTSRCIIEDARSQKRFRLSEEESFNLIRTFGIPTVHGFFAATAEEAQCVASRLGYPLAMKISSEGVFSKCCIQGILLHVTAEHDIRACFDLLRSRATSAAPLAKFRGVYLQPIVRNPNSRSLRLNITQDLVLGPRLTLGLGARDAGISEASASELIPLTEPIARDMVRRLPFAKLLGKFRGMSPINEDSLVQALLYMSRLIAESPAIAELDINPFLVDDKGVIALDCSVVLSDAPASSTYGYPNLVIPPAPAKIERSVLLQAGSMRVRTLRPDDAAKIHRYLERKGKAAVGLLWNLPANQVTEEQVALLCALDYDRAFALVAVDDSTDPKTDVHAMCVAEIVTRSEPFEARIGMSFEAGFLSPKLFWTLLETTEQDLRAKQVKLLSTTIPSKDNDFKALYEQFGFQLPTAAPSAFDCIKLYKRL